MASDSEDDSDAGSLADDEDFIEEIGNEVMDLHKDREAYMCIFDFPAVGPPRRSR